MTGIFRTISKALAVAAIGAVLATAAQAVPLSQILKAPPPFPPYMASADSSWTDDRGIIHDEDVTYTEISGYRPLRLDVYRPAAATEKLPIVMWVHGGAWMVGNPRSFDATFGAWPDVLSQLSARGYVVLAITYRLSGEARFPAQIHDVKAAIRWARLNAEALGADTDRLGVWGMSAGAHLVALAGTSCGVEALEGPMNMPGEVSSCVQAVADWYGPTDFSLMDAQAASLPESMPHGGASPEARLLGCIPFESCTTEAIQAANPITYISGDEPPFLLIHGEEDHIVHIGQSRIFDAALRAKGQSVEFMPVPGADHVFIGASPQVAAGILSKTFSFFDAYLKAGD